MRCFFNKQQLFLSAFVAEKLNLKLQKSFEREIIHRREFYLIKARNIDLYMNGFVLSFSLVNQFQINPSNYIFLQPWNVNKSGDFREPSNQSIKTLDCYRKYYI